MKVMLIGDIYGKTGRDILKKKLPEMMEKYAPDWIIANGENATGGNGISSKHAKVIKSAGVDVITSGNHIFARVDWPETLEKCDYILRPHNIGGDAFAGSGFKVFEKKGTSPIAVMNLAGRVFMEDASCPFKEADKLLALAPEGVPVFLDFHAEATSEKLALFYYLNGRCAACVGTHTHVQTSDDRILSEGTAVITDLGMSGAVDGIIGVDRATVLSRFTKGYSEKFVCASGLLKVEGVVVEIGEEPGKAVSIERFRVI
jgi:hypothetical protein